MAARMSYSSDQWLGMTDHFEKLCGKQAVEVDEDRLDQAVLAMVCLDYLYDDASMSTGHGLGGYQICSCGSFRHQQHLLHEVYIDDRLLNMCE